MNGSWPCRSTRATNNRRQQRPAAAAVELAVAMPVLVLFLLVGIEFYRLQVLRHVADNAAYEAARHVIVPGATADEARERAQQILTRFGVGAAAVTVEPDTLTEQTPSVTVQVDVPVARNAWYLSTFTRLVVLQGRATLRTERGPAVAAKGLLALEPPASGSDSGGTTGGVSDEPSGTETGTDGSTSPPPPNPVPSI